MALNPVSQERRSDPIPFFREILQGFFADNSWDDTLKQWRISIANGGAYPEDVLWCLDYIVEHPPANLPQLLYDDGWIRLERGETYDKLGTPYTPEEQVAWLRERTADFRAEYERKRLALSPVSQERRSDPIAFFRQILKTYFADNSWDDTLKLWRMAISTGGSFAEDALWCLDYVAEHPPANLAELLYQDGWISLDRGETYDKLGTPYTPEEQVAWLRERTELLRDEYKRKA